MDNLTIKVFSKVETGKRKLIRRRSVPRAIEWSTIMKDHLLPIGIQDRYDPHTMTVEYKDADGDYIFIDSDTAWEECLQSFIPSRPLQLFLRRAPGDRSPSLSEGSNISVVSMEEIELRRLLIDSNETTAAVMGQEAPGEGRSAVFDPEPVLNDNIDEAFAASRGATKSTWSPPPSLHRRHSAHEDPSNTSPTSETLTASPKSDPRDQKSFGRFSPDEDERKTLPPKKGKPFRFPEDEDPNDKIQGPKSDQKTRWLMWLEDLWASFLSEAINLSKEANGRVQDLINKSVNYCRRTIMSLTHKYLPT